MANDRSGALGFVPFLEPETPDNPYQDRFVAGFKGSDGLHTTPAHTLRASIPDTKKPRGRNY